MAAKTSSVLNHHLLLKKVVGEIGLRCDFRALFHNICMPCYETSRFIRACSEGGKWGNYPQARRAKGDYFDDLAIIQPATATTTAVPPHIIHQLKADGGRTSTVKLVWPEPDGPLTEVTTRQGPSAGRLISAS